MTQAMQSVFDVAGQSRFHAGSEAPLWWGIVGLLMVESTVVASFIGSYLYFQLVNEHWPPLGVPPPPLLWSSVVVALLLASCGTMWGAGRCLKQDRITPFVALIATSVTLASVTLVMRWQQFEALPYHWDSHPYGSIVWTMTGFHFTHVVSAVLGTAVVAILGVLGFFDSRRQLAVVVDTLYWYFVALVWVPMYLVIYWLPRWTQG